MHFNQITLKIKDLVNDKPSHFPTPFVIKMNNIGTWF